MIWDLEKPCATCPYRRETKKALWHREEFENLERQNANEFGGAVFGCHTYRKRPPEEHRPCVGWVLDQKRQGVPSIQLRIILISNKAACDLFNRLSEEGLNLYRSVSEMVRANYPRRKRPEVRS